MNSIKLLDIGAANPRLDKGWEQARNVDIYMFEPDERSFKLLEKKLINTSNKAFNYALDKQNGIRELFLAEKPELTSFYKPNYDFVNLFPNNNRWQILDSVSVSCKSLNSIHEEIGEYDFIKIDTQGSELDILKGAIGEGLNKTLGIESEVEFAEIYEGQPLFGDVCLFLKEQGFEFYDFIVEYRYGRKSLNRKGQLSFADALFLRTPEYIKNKYAKGEYDMEKVKKYMQICCVYGKTDLVAVVEDYFSKTPEILKHVDFLNEKVSNNSI